MGDTAVPAVRRQGACAENAHTPFAPVVTNSSVMAAPIANPPAWASVLLTVAAFMFAMPMSPVITEPAQQPAPNVSSSNDSSSPNDSSNPNDSRLGFVDVVRAAAVESVPELEPEDIMCTPDLVEDVVEVDPAPGTPTLRFLTLDLEWALDDQSTHENRAKTRTAWEERVESFVQPMIDTKADIIGVQEVGGPREIADIANAIGSPGDYDWKVKDSSYFQKTGLIWSSSISMDSWNSVVPDEPKVLSSRFKWEGLDILVITLQFSQLTRGLPASQASYLAAGIKRLKNDIDLIVVMGNIAPPGDSDIAAKVTENLTKDGLCTSHAENDSSVDAFYICQRPPSASISTPTHINGPGRGATLLEIKLLPS